VFEQEAAEVAEEGILQSTCQKGTEVPTASRPHKDGPQCELRPRILCCLCYLLFKKKPTPDPTHSHCLSDAKGSLTVRVVPSVLSGSSVGRNPSPDRCPHR